MFVSILLLAAALILVGGIFIWVMQPKQKYFKKNDLKRIDQQIKHLASKDPTTQLIQIHTVWHQALKQLLQDQSLTTFEALKQVEDRLPNKEKIWAFHKLRNKAAHEVGMELTPKDISAKIKDIKKALKALSK